MLIFGELPNKRQLEEFTSSFSQQYNYPITPFRLLSYNGNISAYGTYYDSSFGSNESEHIGYKYGFGGNISTRSYVYHPNFLTLTLSGGYQPQYGEVISTLIPDYLTNLSSLYYNIQAEIMKTLDYQVGRLTPKI